MAEQTDPHDPKHKGRKQDEDVGLENEEERLDRMDEDADNDRADAGGPETEEQKLHRMKDGLNE
jgi:hypothetical protein